MSRHFDWRAWLYRWRRWLIAATIILLVRVLLPIVVQKVIASQASKALNATVQVGDVDLGLFSGFVALKDVAVRANTAPPDSPPLIGWKLFSVDLRWLALFHKTIQLEEVVLDTPHVSLERLKEGDLNLMALVPKSNAEPAPAPTPAATPAKPGWAFGVDRIVVRAGGVHFQDFMMAESEPVEVGLPTVAVTDIEIRPGLYGEPAHALVEMKVDDGVLKIDASATLRDDGIAVETQITGERLPLRRSRLYIPKVGWSDMRGTLSMDLVHRIDTNGSRHDLRGAVGLQDLLVNVPGLEDAALTWRTLNVRVDPVDLVEQRVTVVQADLDGLTLPVRTGGDVPLPLLRALLAKTPEPQSSPATPPAEATPKHEATPSAESTASVTVTSEATQTVTPDATLSQPSATPEASPPPNPDSVPPTSAPAKPWHWAVNAAQLTDAKLLVLHRTGRMDAGVGAEVHDLVGEGDQVAALKLGLTIGEGSLNVDGNLRLAPIGFAGHIVIDKLSVPEVVVASSVVPPEILPAARLALDLNAETGSLAPTPGDLTVTGTITLTDVQAAPPAPQGMHVGLRSLTLGVDQLHLAGVLAADPSAHRGDTDLRGKIALAGLHVAQPEQPTIDLSSLEIGLDQVHLAGVLAPAEVATRGDTEVRGRIALAGLHVVQPEHPTIDLGSLQVGLDQLHLAGVLAPAAVATRGDTDVRGKIGLAELRVTQPEHPGIGVGSLDVGFDELHVAGLLAPPGLHQGDLRLKGRISVTDPRVFAPGAKEPAASVKTVDLTLDEVNGPALLAKAVVEGQGAAPGNLTARGKLHVVEPRAVAANPKEFSAAVKSIDAAFDEVQVPNPQDPKPGPLRVRLGDVRIAQPNVQVTRTKDGIVLPQLAPAKAPPSAAPTPAPSPVAAAPTASPSIELSIASFQVSKGRIAFTDRAVKPFYSGVIAPLEIELKEVRFPELAAGNVRVDAAVTPSGTIKATGKMGPAGGTVDVKVDDMALTPFNPYATAYSAYSIADGSLSLGTKASFTPGGYKADTSIVLHQLDVSGAEGDSLFQQNFGIPLTVALALLKDMSGNITLDVPLEADREGMKVGIGTIVAGALRSALLGVLESPLKLIGMVLPGSKEAAAAPPQIAFRAGRAEPGPESEAQIKQLATFISGRPGMGVTLEPVPSTRDVRWLREHALLEELGKPQGIFGAVKNIGQGGKRERIGKALAARGQDEAGELNDEDAKTLDEWLDARPSPSPAQLQALADARVAKLEQVLHDDYGVDAARIARSEATLEPTDDPAVVRLHIGIAKK
jgi:uncharacterized protein involved in outer membrane biogenesis